MDKIKESLDLILSAIDEKNGDDTNSVYVAEFTSVADYFVITSGDSTTKVNSIADNVISKMEKEGFLELKNRAGYQNAKWVLLDYGDIVVHIFLDSEREFYNLESLWEEFES